MASKQLQPGDPWSRSYAGRGRKVRTSDCRKCVIMSGLLAAGVPAAVTTAICDRMWLTVARRRQYLYSEGNGATHLYAIRRGKWKLVVGSTSCPACTEPMLFDLEADLAETDDRSRHEPQVLDELLGAFRAWNASVARSRSVESRCGQRSVLV